MIAEFVHDCRAYAEARGISLVTLGLYAVSDSRLFSRLDNGGQCLPRTMDRVRAYMSANPVGSDFSVISPQPAATAAQPQEHPHVPDLQNP